MRIGVLPSMLLAISGLAGTGKDTVADILTKGSLVKVALADPLKRIVRDVYDFSEEQLWGPSFKRNEPDLRYPRPHSWREIPDLPKGPDPRPLVKCACCGIKQNDDSTWDGSEEGLRKCYLTPRYSLQTLGTEWGRDNFPDTWVCYTIRIHDKLQEGGHVYDQKSGLRYVSYVDQAESLTDPTVWVKSKKNVVVPDTRFKNELRLIRNAGGKVVRVTRPGVEVPAWAHPSETEQMEIPDSEFDYIIRNDSTLEDLLAKTHEMAEKLAV